MRQTKYKAMMTKEGSTKILDFMTPGAGVLMLGRGHISNYYSEYFLLLYQNVQYIEYYCVKEL